MDDGSIQLCLCASYFSTITLTNIFIQSFRIIECGECGRILRERRLWHGPKQTNTQNWTEIWNENQLSWRWDTFHGLRRTSRFFNMNFELKPLNHWLVCPSVRPSVRLSIHFYAAKNKLKMIEIYRRKVSFHRFWIQSDLVKRIVVRIQDSVFPFL